MARFYIKIAGHTLEVCSLFESTRHYCADYLTDGPGEFSIAVTREDLTHQQALAFEEAKQEGLRPRVFTEQFLERQAIQSKAAQLLLSRDVLLMHGSAVAVDGVGYLFTAPCRTGKSTHTRLWCQVFGSRAVMVNDDKPFLRLTSEAVELCGSPWSGKHGIQTNVTVPLGGICILRRGGENRIHRLKPEDGADFLLHQGSAPEEGALMDRYEALVKELLCRVPLWHMTCTKEPAAAQVAYEAMSDAQ